MRQVRRELKKLLIVFRESNQDFSPAAASSDEDDDVRSLADLEVSIKRNEDRNKSLREDLAALKLTPK